MATDPMLPPETRAAFPLVYAIDETPPIFGYLMEDLEDYTPISKSLAGGSDHAKLLLRGLWNQVLAPAYRATKRARLAHDLDDDYVGRARSRLTAAASRGVLPAAEEPITVRTRTATMLFPGGWGEALTAAGVELKTVRPRFGTWVHGDPNPENALWSTGADGGLVFRLLDPKDWWTGDYLFDVAKLGHYVALTSPLESGAASATAQRDGEGWRITIDDEACALGHEIEAALLAEVEPFAEEVGDEHWRDRYRLAFAANLFSIAGPRATRGLVESDKGQTSLGWGALGYALVHGAQSE
jgi:hypothetical protein